MSDIVTLNGYKIKDEKAVRTYETVALMKADTKLKEGYHVKTKGYYEANDGGNAEYIIVDDDTLVNDGGLIHVLSNGLRAKLINNIITPEMCGAVGDGETDDTTAIQTAIDVAHEKGLTLNLSNKTYITSDSLNIYSNLEIDGNNATIKNETNHAIITSLSIISGINIHDLTLVGANNEEYTDNKGIDLICYYSKFNNLLISLCHSGIFLHHDGASGTLVENRLSNIRVNNYYQYGIYLGANGNNKLTDGYLSNVICNGNSNSLTNQYGIFLGSSAGWCIDGVHIYGQNYNAMACSNAYFTNISNIYIESFTNYGLAMGSTQTGANITNINIKHNNVENTGTAIRIETASYMPFTTHAGNLTNVRIVRGSSTNGKSIVNTGQQSFNGCNVIIDGATRNIINDCSGINFTMNGLINMDDYSINKYNSTTKLSTIKGYKFKGFNPNTTSITIENPGFTVDNQEGIYEVTAVGGQYTTQSGLFYKGLIQIVYKSGSYNVRIKTIENDLFTTNPSVALDSDNNITLSFAVGSTIYGNIFYELMHN